MCCNGMLYFYLIWRSMQRQNNKTYLDVDYTDIITSRVLEYFKNLSKRVGTIGCRSATGIIALKYNNIEKSWVIRDLQCIYV